MKFRSFRFPFTRTSQLISYTFILALFLSACDGNVVYKDHQELSPNLEWKRVDSRSFTVKIEDTTVPYNLKVALRYANGFAYRILRIKMIETGPDGSSLENEYDLQVVNEQGEYIGEPGYDIWDSEHMVVEGLTYSKAGEYTYTIEHLMPEEVVNLAMEIGLIVEKVPQNP